ncbi:MAG: hypothetical protein ACRC80_32965 [Waterburya sp.]
MQFISPVILPIIITIIAIIIIFAIIDYVGEPRQSETAVVVGKKTAKALTFTTAAGVAIPREYDTYNLTVRINNEEISTPVEYTFYQEVNIGQEITVIYHIGRITKTINVHHCRQ